jgi:hypothetical protein
VPANGSVSITHVYNYSTSQNGIRALAADTQDAAQPPAVSIQSPADGSTTQSSAVTVVGAASDDSGTPSLKVNGVPTPVQPDGSWSQRVALQAGANTITAVVTDKAGNSSQAAETLSYQPVPANCQVPNVVGVATAQALAGLQAANCTVGKQLAVTSSTVKAGRVVSQGMAPGTIAAVGTHVDITVSKGAFPSARLASTKGRLRGSRMIIAVKCASTGAATNGTVKLRKVSGKHQTLDTKAFQCPSGKKRNVIFTFSKSTAAALHKAKKTTVYAYIVSRGPGGAAASKRFRMTIVG